ncbi:MAG TPA: hypothetical protein VMY35_17440 [Phycisphaerae bacterium]|nr:hypothetical protein [Phycisphaerae bacterium]
MSQETRDDRLTERLSVNVEPELSERINAVADRYIPGGLSRSQMTRILLLKGLDSISHVDDSRPSVADSHDPSET